jgi:outer membrane protein assembly factor BamB
MQAIAYNPVDDTLYGFKRPTGEVYTIDRTTGVPTLDATRSIVVPDPFTTCEDTPLTRAYRLDLAVFDANGNLWVQGDACDDGELLAIDFATGVVSWKGQWTDTAGSLFPAGDTFYAESVFIITVEDAPALPDTGASAMVLVATGTIGAGLLAAGALALVMVRRRLAGK